MTEHPARRARARHGGAGFSLIELMIGLAIFSSAFLMLLGIFPTSAQALHESRMYSLGAHVAEQVMEQYVINQSFGNVVDRTSGTNDPISGAPIPAVTLLSKVNGATQAVTYNWQIVVTPETGTLKNVRLQVWWVDQAASGVSKVRYVNMETRVADFQG